MFNFAWYLIPPEATREDVFIALVLLVPILFLGFTNTLEGVRRAPGVFGCFA